MKFPKKSVKCCPSAVIAVASLASTKVKGKGVWKIEARLVPPATPEAFALLKASSLFGLAALYSLINASVALFSAVSAGLDNIDFSPVFE